MSTKKVIFVIPVIRYEDEDDSLVLALEKWVSEASHGSHMVYPPATDPEVIKNKASLLVLAESWLTTLFDLRSATFTCIAGHQRPEISSLGKRRHLA